MIFRSYVSDFLAQPVRDLGEVKRWSVAKLDRKIAKFEPTPTFVTEPRKHQKVGFVLGASLYYLELLFDLGTGKTKVALDIIRYLQASGRVRRRVLILVPNVVNIEGWKLEIAIHAPDLRARFLTGDKTSREEAFRDGESDICVGTYSGMQHLLCSRPAKKGKRKKGKMVIDAELLATTKKMFDGIVCDESTSIMNIHSLSFRIIRQLTKDFRMRLGLTGTPMGRDPQALWSQFYAVDRGEALGDSLGLFRGAFFTEEEGYWARTYKFKKKMEGLLRQKMAHSSIRYSIKECADLPKRTKIQLPFLMTEEQWSYYHAILEQAAAVRAGKLLDIGGIFTRLRQIASGFVSLEGTPSPLAENPKLAALLELIAELPANDKIVVFNDFIFSGNTIQAALKQQKIPCSRIYSGTKDKAAELAKFLDKGPGGTKVLLANSQSAGMGGNFQVARFCAYYESPVSPIIRQQSEGRVFRMGQTRNVFQYDLYARHTVEEKILRYLREGRDLLKVLLASNSLNAIQRRKRERV